VLSATTTISKGWFNQFLDTISDCTQPPMPDPNSLPVSLHAIATCLANPIIAGVTTNMDGLDDPTHATGLYFDKAGRGRITFTSALNLTDQANRGLLEALGTKMKMHSGKVGLDARTAIIMKNLGATLSIYDLKDLGYNNIGTSSLSILDDNGNPISTSSPDFPTLGNVGWDGNAATGTLTFSASHFTEFDINPIVTEVTTITSPTASTSPYYTFSTNASGTASFGGDCSGTAAASTTIGNNIVQFGPLSLGAHTNCTVTVTDLGGASTTLNVTPFTIFTGSVRLPVNLGMAGNFAILAKSGITGGAGSTITGDIGVSPIDSTAMTGFAQVLDSSGTFSSSSVVTGRLYAADYTSPTPSMLTTAVSDMEAAYTDASTRPTPDYTNLGAGNIGGMTLAPGLYKWTTGVTIPTDLTLSGSSTAVWIFQIAGNLDISSAKHIILADNAQAKNIFWVVAGNVALNTTSVFNGNIICTNSSGLHLYTGATLNGRALSTFDVTLQSNIVTIPEQSSAKSILSFTVPGQTGSTTINEASSTINIIVPVGTNITALHPTIAITGVSVSPTSGTAHDFTASSTYTVTAADSTTHVYTVTVTPAGPVFIDTNVNGILDSGESSFNTIQAAIDAASSGDTIFVKAGTYNENVNVNKSVTLKGESSSTVIVTALSSTTSVFTVSTSSVNISGFTLTGTKMPGNQEGYAGIYFTSGVASSSIHDNIVSNNQYGILMIGTLGDTSLGNNTFTNNTASNCTVSGIEMQNTNGNTFTNNIANVDGAQGYRIANSKHNTFTGNIANSGNMGFYMVSASGSSDNNTFTNNTANLNSNHGMYLTNGNNNTFTGNTFNSNVSSGFRMKNATNGMTNLILSDNTISGNAYGINIDSTIPDVSTWTVTNNSISSSTTYGVSNSAATGTLNATNNWWGSSVLATVAAKITGNVNFKPYYIDSGKTTLSNIKAITGFAVTGQVGTTGINESAHTITFVMSTSTGLASLTPTISLTGVSVSPVSGASHDFTSTTTYTVTSIDGASTQAYVVTARVLSTTQTAPVAGAATISSSTPEVIITNPTATTTLTINSDVVAPTIDVSSFISNGTGTLPAINITSANAASTTVQIPASTVVTSASTTWNGVMEAPVTNTTVTLPTTSGYSTNLSTAIELGIAGQTLTFSNGVRILLVGQAGMNVGYSVTGTDFTPITNICATDTQATGNSLSAGSECKIDVGSDLVIWTKHFTTFAAYSQTANQVAQTYGGSGGGAGGSVGSIISPIVVATTTSTSSIAWPTNVITTSAAPAVSGYNFTKDLTIGSIGADVTALQQVLVNGGYLVMPVGVAYGKFGNLTRDALIKYQKAKGITPAAGYFGAKTRSVLNASAVSSTQNIASMSLKQLVQMLLQIGAIASDKIDAANKLVNSL
jgi:parallel beta-helix repeat protein